MNEIKEAVKTFLKRVLESEKVSAANKIPCKNFRDHSLEGAKEVAKKVSDEGILILEIIS
ncbi:MAG TPA: hypothetical protein DCE09_05770 [Thermoanaerobacter sp.]|uniref:S-ribosylhomocysteine lyase n=1 Tax=Caldanaerobacter subterraneus TaxID=911092 RepID=UPI0009D71994|nr:S-ribosylhomocysteine lyase [Caldanaerobacter subterraneus]HAA81072.1 hypothetical protein [Thermoanaerobacter sp.]